MQKLSQKSGWLTIWAISLFPVVPWLMLKPIDSRFVDGWTVATSLGQLTGLVGMSMFGLNLILSARTKGLDKFFNGLNLAYIKHHQLGALSFSLLLLHPLLLAIKYGQTSWLLAAQLLIPNSLASPIGYGVSALILMIILLVLTFYIKLPYHIWKLSHKFLGLAYFLATLHLISVYSDTSQSLTLKAYMLSLSFMALSAVFYRTVAGKALVPTCPYRVEAVNRMNGNVFEVVMKPENRAMAYNPGQFIFISFEQRGFKEKHPFTISSAGGAMSVTVKNLGNYTSQLGELKIGTRAIIEGPYGQFSYHHSMNKKQVWLAGGIGITPFLSMARSLGESSDYEIDLIYCTKNANEAVFIDELKSLASSRSWFRVYDFCSDEQGRISADVISKMVGGLKERDYFLCGPPAMMSSIRQQLKNYDIPEAVIHSEEFAML